MAGMAVGVADSRVPRLLSRRAKRSMCVWAAAGQKPATEAAEAAAAIPGSSAAARR